MNIVIDILFNSIYLAREQTKKAPRYFHVKKYDYALDNAQNIEKAFTDLLKDDESNILKNESNSLIIGDENIGFGLVELPPLSRFKVKDVFNTRIKMAFPDYKDYFLDSFELEKTQNNITYFYAICRKEYVNRIINLLKQNSISVKKVDFFANYYANGHENKSAFPVISLFIGDKNSELIISKGKHVLSINILDYGEDLLLSGNEYLHSSYAYKNDKAYQYSKFIKDNFASKEIATDENIEKTSVLDAMDYAKPKELRILKDGSLNKYNIRTNARKYCSMIEDLISYYSGSPWFIPTKEIKVMCSNEMFNLLESVDEFKHIKLIKNELTMDEIVFKDVDANVLFSSSIKGERRKIDWSKFLTFEIGKKKKA